MRATELSGWLATLGVPGGLVGIGTETDRTWCVRPVPDDEGWEVFWCERGGRYEWTRFDDESAACFHLVGRLVWAHTTGRGGAG